MRVPTGIHCQTCGVELNQDISGNMYCACGRKVRFIDFTSGNGISQWNTTATIAMMISTK